MKSVRGLFSIIGIGCLLLTGSVLAATQDEKKADATPGKYNDGTADGKKSLGGSGEMIRFSMPDADQKVAGIRIHGSRYGVPKAPDEKFLIYFLNADGTEIFSTQM